MQKICQVLCFLLFLLCFSCKEKSDSKEYFFISSTSELIRENELIVNMDSVFVHRFILRVPYSQYGKLFNDTLTKEKSSVSGNNNPFLMVRFTVTDSAKEDVAISDLSLHVYKLYDSIPGDELPVHAICTGNLEKPMQGYEIAKKAFSVKDTIKIKAGTMHPVIFMTADYDLKDHLEDATFLLRTQLTIKYKNAFNIVDMVDTIVKHDRY